MTESRASFSISFIKFFASGYPALNDAPAPNRKTRIRGSVVFLRAIRQPPDRTNQDVDEVATSL